MARTTWTTRRLVVLVLGALALAAVTGGVAAPAVDDDDDKPLTGATLERASRAALAHTGEGTVVDSETGDDGAAYGVEVRLVDGSQVEVSLNDDFDVLGQETDDDGEEGANSSDD